MGEIVGYARVSSADQSLALQEEQLRAAGCTRVFSEKRSGTSRSGRKELERALDYVREGDIFVVTRIDRLARSITDLRQTVDFLAGKGVGFRAVQQAGVDTTSSAGKLFLGMLGLFAEFETDLRSERQREGIAKAKAEGRHLGRPLTVPVEDVNRLAAEGLTPSQIQKKLRIGRGSVYRALAKASA